MTDGSKMEEVNFFSSDEFDKVASALNDYIKQNPGLNEEDVTLYEDFVVALETAEVIALHMDSTESLSDVNKSFFELLAKRYDQ